jgi:hypothetical protein
MVPKEFLFIATEDSDQLGALLVSALRTKLTRIETGYAEGFQPLHASVEPRFFGAGGPQMSAAGVELVSELPGRAAENQLSKRLADWRAFEQLYSLAVKREPHAIVCLGFFDFNIRFAKALKQRVRREAGTFYNWRPVICQVDVSRAGFSKPSKMSRLGECFDYILIPQEEGVALAVSSAAVIDRIDASENAADPVQVANRAADRLVRLLQHQEEQFPLRAFLSES